MAYSWLNPSPNNPNRKTLQLELCAFLPVPSCVDLGWGAGFVLCDLVLCAVPVAELPRRWRRWPKLVGILRSSLGASSEEVCDLFLVYLFCIGVVCFFPWPPDCCRGVQLLWEDVSFRVSWLEVWFRWLLPGLSAGFLLIWLIHALLLN